MATQLKLRSATIKDLALLKYWDQQPHVIISDLNEENWEVELARNPEWREQLIAEKDGEPIGCIQIIDPALEDTHYWGEIPSNLRAIDIWIGEKKNLSRGYGTIIMRLAFDRIFVNPLVTAILIDPLASNTKAHRFYERLGFQFVEERMLEGSLCFIYKLKREAWEIQE